MSISTCALREEGDPAIIKITASHSGFLSTPSARRATDRQKHSSRTFTISIHALREEGDGMCWGFPRRRPKFYPRPPRGGRPFLVLNTGRTEQISIHALREEGDPIPTPRRGESNQFLSTPSARRATPKAVKASVTMSIFYPRPPRGGRPPPPALPRRLVRVFLSTPSARRATNCNE